ncbi:MULTISPECIES: glucose-6-phosphate isomerase [Gammaproteobacteria]|uniref:glucose-6-phosphate isomerase n=1 Tax=Gammaproteobacteria TaxID=1236 RepID=UPI000DD0D96E|nr:MULTISPECIES: glucose-6-phosphate isomerase [Gammaproteobacteria]RTE86093.1 glucose-6-phosphate isomerase [Aliidiomarina sp. B3213]TCZ91447.1 glucose-6-phosphate isomerase [Lysobacter sp. N42]
MTPKSQTVPLQQIQFNQLIFDWSYQFLSHEDIRDFAQRRLPNDFNDIKTRLLEGKYTNATESRPVSHTLCRNSDVLNNAESKRFIEIVKLLRKGEWLGATGEAITDVVNIGVGGSDLGPLMSSFALKEFATDKNARVAHTHFVSSMDGEQLHVELPHLNPETTLFIVASKSFGTADTFANVDTVKTWALERLNIHGKTESDWLQNHLVAVSAYPEKMDAFGIPRKNQLAMNEGVGGRFSLWSAMGLSIAISCGLDVFERLLSGARDMDEHFATAPIEKNIPMLMALLGVYNREVRAINNLAILPYDGRFLHVPSYLQQLDMESNGKQCSADNKAINYPTGPIVWGAFGPNGQHAFFQHLHQGFDKFAADFLMVLQRKGPGFSLAVQSSLADQQELSVANCLAHRKLMAYGSEDGTARNYYPGGHPSNLLALKELTPESFGAIIAAYEHKVFTQGVIWNLNSFDQPGVELGKKIAVKTLAAIQNRSDDSFDESTDSFIKMTRD